MTNYAVIENGIITNVIVADTKEIAEDATKKICVEIVDTYGIGDIWDGNNFHKTKPVIEGEVVPPAIEG